MKANFFLFFLAFSLLTCFLFAQESLPGKINIPSFFALIIIIVAILNIFPKLKIHQLFTAISTNVVTLIFAIFSLSVLSHIIAGIIMVTLIAINTTSGRYKHQTKGGKMDRRYKNNHYLGSAVNDIETHSIWSIIPLIISGLVYAYFIR